MEAIPIINQIVESLSRPQEWTWDDYRRTLCHSSGKLQLEERPGAVNRRNIWVVVPSLRLSDDEASRVQVKRAMVALERAADDVVAVLNRDHIAKALKFTVVP